MYVQAYGDDIVGTGEENSPVATISKALDIVYEKTQSGYEGEAEIIVGDGNYYVDSEITINNAASAAVEKLTIKAADGAVPTLTGGIPYSVADAVKVEDEAVLSRLSDQSVRDNLYSINLYSKVSSIPVAAHPGAYKIPWDTAPSTTAEMFYNGDLMTVSRYPNDGYSTVASVVNEGAIPRAWEDDYIGRDSYVEEADRDKTDVFVIGYDDERASKWTNADQGLMFGFWKFDWATQTVPLASVDTVNKTITAGLPSYYGVNQGARYYVFNLLEEIDIPGEYFIDRSTGIMYFYKPENAAATDEIIMTVKDFSIFNLSNAQNVEINGINFNACRNAAIKITSGTGISIKNCEISNTADFAIKASGTSILIDGCYIHDVDGGISISGGTSKTLTPSNNVVSNNEIENFSRISKTYTSAVSVSGVGTTVTHNKIHESEHMAIGYSGNEHTISYNEIYNVCKEADDAGAIYAGRTWTNRGNKIIGNYIHDINSGVSQIYACSGVFFDDHYAGGYVEGNVFENIAGNGIKGNGGREMTFTNNVFIGCTRGIYIQNASSQTFVNHYKSLNSSYYQTDIWKEKYPKLYYILDNAPEEHRDNVVTNNLIYNCDTAYSFGAKVSAYLYNDGNYDAGTTDPGFTDLANGIYSFKEDADVFTLIPGFKNIEFEKIGIQN